MPVRIPALFLALLVLTQSAPAQYVRRRVRTIGPNNGVPGETVPPVEMRGKLRDIDKKKIVIDAGEDQILTFKRMKKTKFLKGTKEIQPDDFPDGAAVVIEANRAQNGDYEAVNVFLGEPPPADKPASEAAPKPETPASSGGSQR